MKKHEPQAIQIAFKDAKSTMTPAEYSVWRSKWDRFWAKLIGEAGRQIEEDKKKGVKFKPTPKSELVRRSLEMAEQLDIKLPKSFKRLSCDDVYLIEGN
jgi:hypothetical protein